MHQSFPPTYRDGETSLVTVAMMEYGVDLARSFKNLGKWQLENENIGKIMAQCREKEDFSHFTVYRDILFHQEAESTF